MILETLNIELERANSYGFQFCVQAVRFATRVQSWRKKYVLALKRLQHKKFSNAILFDNQSLVNSNPKGQFIQGIFSRDLGLIS